MDPLQNYMVMFCSNQNLSPSSIEYMFIFNRVRVIFDAAIEMKTTYFDVFL